MLLFSDDLNFKKENFPSLYKALEQLNFPYQYDSSHNELKKSWGQYSSLKLAPNFLNLPVDVKSETHVDFPLFEVYKSELYFYALSSIEWIQNKNHTTESILEYMLESQPEIVNKMRQISVFWLDYWLSLTKSSRFSGYVVFGGNLIYTRALVEIAKTQHVPVLALEHLFTGHDYYMEERYEPLPNNSILKSDRYIDYQKSLVNIDYLDAINKLRKKTNKNVAPSPYLTISKHNYCLLITQVSNDFAIASEANPFKNSIAFYLDLVQGLLEKTDLDVVIKTHPYEKKKNRDGRAITYELLDDFLSTCPLEQQSRVTLVEDHSLEALIDNCKYAVVLNSQAGLEVLSRGKPLACFGNPFYGRKNFTHDYSSLNNFINNQHDIKLTASQVTAYWNFMSICFTHLVGANEQDKASKQLNKIFNIKLPTPTEHRAPKDSVLLTTTNKKADQKIQEHKASKTSLEDVKKKSRTHKLPLINVPVKPKQPKDKSRWRSNLRKLRRNPRAFFLDSKFKLFKMIGRNI